MLRHPKDKRTLVWSLVLFPMPTVLAYVRPAWVLPLLPVWLYLGFCAGVLAHYHNHRAVFSSRVQNRLYSVWLSAFYGCPLWAWIPTHNQNHHKFVNGPGDATRTDLACPEDSLWSVVSYPTRSSPQHLPLLRAYLGRLWHGNRRAFAWACAELAIVPTFQILVLLGLLARYPTSMALGSFAAATFLPAAFASWSMMAINYLQHVGCDPRSADNHSRNFVGRVENWFVFDAGLHTVHHEHPGEHFSRYRSLHEARAGAIAPELCEQSILTFLWRRYGPWQRRRPLTAQNRRGLRAQRT